MNNLIAITSNKLLLILSAGFAWFVVKYLPSAMALFGLAIAVLCDLGMGLIKSWHRKMCTMTEGLIQTLIKIGIYCITIVALTILVNIIGVIDINNTYPLHVLINTLLSFMIFIEIFSVFKKISLLYPKWPLTRYLINPLLKLMRFKLNQGPPGIPNSSPNT